MLCFYLSANPTVNDLTFTAITSTTITLTWSPPSVFVPTSYEIDQICRRLCEFGFSPIVTFYSVSSPRQSTGIPPYSQCIFNLIGLYGSDRLTFLTNYAATTLSAGKILLYQWTHY